MQNLYPALQYLGIRLKYICCKSPGKLPLIERHFGVTATTELDTVLADDEVKGVFLCVSPQSHYDICMRVIGVRQTSVCRKTSMPDTMPTAEADCGRPKCPYNGRHAEKIFTIGSETEKTSDKSTPRKLLHRLSHRSISRRRPRHRPVHTPH